MHPTSDTMPKVTRSGMVPFPALPVIPDGA